MGKAACSAAAMLLLTACASDSIPIFPLPEVANPEQASEVTFIRPRAIVASEFPFYITLGERPVFDLRSGEYTRFRIASGRQSIAMRCLGGPASKPTETRIERDFIAGRAEFFVVEPKFECASIEPVGAQAAAALIPRTRFRAVGTVSKLAEMSGAPSSAPTTTSAPPAVVAAPVDPKDQVAAATAAWVEAFNSRDPARIAALYDPEAVLSGTAAQKPITGAAIAEYFRNAMQRPANRASLGEHQVRVYADTAIDTGTYMFSEVRDGSVAAVLPERYTLVYRNRGGKWMIVEHHSSRVPAP
jgi:uncharacterized protein (TIGR02246 family)